MDNTSRYVVGKTDMSVMTTRHLKNESVYNHNYYSSDNGDVLFAKYQKFYDCIDWYLCIPHENKPIKYWDKFILGITYGSDEILQGYTP